METPGIIIGNAHDLLMVSGIKNISMDDIAHELNLTKNTINQLFGSESAFAGALIDKEIENNVSDCKILIDKSDDVLIGLFFIMVQAKKFYNKIGRLNFKAIEKYNDEVFKKLGQHKDGFLFQSIKNNIRQGTTEKLYRNDFNIDLMARFLVETVVIVAESKVFMGASDHFNDLAEEIFAHLINGLTTRKGMELINKYKNQQGILVLTEAVTKPFWDA